MKKFELTIEGYHTPLTSAQIAELFQAGRVRRSDPCREVGQQNWRTLDELFPLLKYDAGGRGSMPSPTKRNSAVDHVDNSSNLTRPLTSALKAGWICFGIGLLLSWFFPLGNAFFSVAIITAIVAMCTHQVNRGLALLVSSFFAIGLCALISFTLVVGAVAVATGAAIKGSQAQMKRLEQTRPQQFQQLNNAGTPLQSALRTSSNQLSFSTFSSTMPSITRDTSDDRQKQYELAVAQQREVNARNAADQTQRARSVYDAERRRDSVKAKEQRLQQVQNSIDWNDQRIRQMREINVSTKTLEDQRDALLKEKAKLQGY